MTADLRIRRFRSADAARVRDLHEAAMRDVGAYVEGVPDEDLEAITETYLETGGEFLVGEHESEGRIVAMGAFRPIEETDFAVRCSIRDRCRPRRANCKSRLATKRSLENGSSDSTNRSNCSFIGSRSSTRGNTGTRSTRRPESFS